MKKNHLILQIILIISCILTSYALITLLSSRFSFRSTHYETHIVSPTKMSTHINDYQPNFQLDPNLAVGSTTQTNDKIVYLTFDDGPSANTQDVLDILDQYDAKATFFVTGLNPDYFPLIKKAYDKGHTIGLHTMSHDYSQIYASESSYLTDLSKIGNLVKQQIGYIPCFLRFPGGSSNTISAKYAPGIMPKLTQDILKLGYQYYDWNSDSNDGSGIHSAHQLYLNATSSKENNIVILCHDALGKESTIEALPRIIEHYQSKGYLFQSINRKSYAPHHNIYNK